MRLGISRQYSALIVDTQHTACIIMNKWGHNKIYCLYIAFCLARLCDFIDKYEAYIFVLFSFDKILKCSQERIMRQMNCSFVFFFSFAYHFGMRFKQYLCVLIKIIMHAMHKRIMRTFFSFSSICHTNIISILPTWIVHINPNFRQTNTSRAVLYEQVIKINDLKNIKLITRIHFKCRFWCNCYFQQHIILHYSPLSFSFFKMHSFKRILNKITRILIEFSFGKIVHFK